jgi:hypothetical protein
MRLPSVKTLCEAFPDLTPEYAEILRAILRLEKRPKDYPDKFPHTLEWIRACYNKPSMAEVNMRAADELLGGHGVEAIFEDGAMWPWLEYVNTGDAYNVTLCRVDGNYRVQSWGGIVERDNRGRA